MKKSFYKHSTFLILACLVVFVFIATSCGVSTTPTGSTGATTNAVAPSPPKAVPSPPVSNETMGQQNAVATAISYLNSSSFSKSGLIGQLEYEGYSTADATYAVDKLNVDWRAQAVLTAKSYLNSSSFSKSGLIDQLEYEGFSTADAAYAVTQVGY